MEAARAALALTEVSGPIVTSTKGYFFLRDELRCLFLIRPKRWMMTTTTIPWWFADGHFLNPLHSAGLHMPPSFSSKDDMHLPHTSGIPLVGGGGLGRGGGIPLGSGKEGMPGLSTLSNFGMGKDGMHVPGLPPALGSGKEGIQVSSR